MIVRSLLLVASFALIGLGLLASVLVPGYGNLIFYGLLAWILISFGLGRLPVMARPVGGRPRGSATASTPPAGGAAAPAPASEPLGFCIYCGTLLPEGAPVCPSCGRSVRSG